MLPLPLAGATWQTMESEAHQPMPRPPPRAPLRPLRRCRLARPVPSATAGCRRRRRWPRGGASPRRRRSPRARPSLPRVAAGSRRVAAPRASAVPRRRCLSRTSRRRQRAARAVAVPRQAPRAAAATAAPPAAAPPCPASGGRSPVRAPRVVCRRPCPKLPKTAERGQKHPRVPPPLSRPLVFSSSRLLVFCPSSTGSDPACTARRPAHRCTRPARERAA